MLSSNSQSKMSFLTLGAGELGISVLKALTNTPYITQHASLSVLLRPESIASHDPAKVAEIRVLRDLGVDIVAGDLAAATVSDLAAIFAPFHTIIGCTGFVAGPGTQIKIAHAVLEARVPRYVPWQFGVDYDEIGRGSAQDLFDEQLDVRDLLRGQQQTQWTIISTGVFTDFLFSPFFGIVNPTSELITVRALGSLENRITVTTVEDIGRLTAEILCAEVPLKNTIVHVAGDTVSYNQVADIVEDVIGRAVLRQAWDLTQLKEELDSDPNDTLKKYRLVFAHGRGVSWDVGETYNAQFGIAVTTARQWSNENLRRRLSKA